MNNQLEQNNSLLFQIKSKDISLLIKDLELEKDDKYIINFIIDPYDIFRFSFPYGIKFADVSGRSLDEIGDEMLAYSQIFEKYRPIILDEYKLELFLNRNNILNNLSDFTGKNLFDTWTDQYDEASLEDKDQFHAELEQSASFLLSTALLTESFIDHFNEIFQKLLIDDLRMNNLNENDRIKILQAFSDNNRSEWSIEALKQWVREKENSNFFKKKDQQEISKEIQNTFRDFVVIDRICTINNQLQTDNNLNGNYLFLYFSSAYKSEDIFSMSLTQEHFPLINGESHNVLRSVKHSYLKFLFGDQPADRIIDDLNKLKEITDKWEAETDLKEKIREKIKDYDGWFESYKQKRRDGLELNLIERRINTHKDFKSALNLKIEEFKGIKKENNIYLFKKFYEDLLTEAESKKNVNALENMKITYFIEFSLTELLKMVVEQEYLNLHKGLDAVKGNYHHLPILLFLYNHNAINKKLINLLHEVTKFVVKSPKIQKNELKGFYEKIKNLYSESEMYFNSTEKSYAGALVKSLIYLILPYNVSVEKQEKEAHAFVWDMAQISSQGEFAKSEKLQDTFWVFDGMSRFYHKLKSDYQYFLIWSFRRTGKIKNSLDLAEEAIRTDPDDPRFYHGKCLALYNTCITPHTLQIKDFNDLVSLVENAEKAISLYLDLIDDVDENNIIFIKGSIVALQNLLLYVTSLVHLADLEGNEPTDFVRTSKLSKYNLSYLRNCLLESITSFERETNKQDSKDFPELAQTESVLELCEAIANSNNQNVSQTKIANSRLAVMRALSADRDSKLYKLTMDKILEWEAKLSY